MMSTRRGRLHMGFTQRSIDHIRILCERASLIDDNWHVGGDFRWERDSSSMLGYLRGTIGASRINTVLRRSVSTRGVAKPDYQRLLVALGLPVLSTVAEQGNRAMEG